MQRGMGGFSSLYKDSRRNVIQSPSSYTCQKCLQVGHFTYECKGERKYVQRQSKTQILKRKIEGGEDKAGGGFSLFVELHYAARGINNLYGNANV